MLRTLFEDLAAPECAVEAALRETYEKVAQHHWVKDAGVQERGVGQSASLVVEAECLGLGDEAPESGRRRFVPHALVGQQILQVDAPVRTRLV